MFGHSTIFLKRGKKTDVCFGANYWMREVINHCEKEDISVFECMADEIKGEEIKQKNVTQKEVEKIITARTARDEDINKPFYHKLAADMYFLIDFDEKKFFKSISEDRKSFLGWEEMKTREVVNFSI